MPSLILHVDETLENIFEISAVKAIEKSIIELLETRVKPVVASHGGEISFNSFKNGTGKIQ